MSNQKEQTIIGYKATDKNLKCREYQYEVGKTYTAKGKISLCKNGFHFCENPFDVIDYYNLCECDFVSIESRGKTETDGKKTVTKKIKISAHIGLSGWIKASFDFLWSRCTESENKNTHAQLASSGNSAKLASSGNSAQLASSGDYCVVAGIGVDNSAKGKKGTWLVLSEWKYSEDAKTMIPLCVKVELVDGIRIKEDIWYILKNGEFSEVKE